MNKLIKLKELENITNGELCNLLLYSDVKESTLKYLLKYFNVINNDSVKRLINIELNNNTEIVYDRLEFLESLL